MGSARSDAGAAAHTVQTGVAGVIAPVTVTPTAAQTAAVAAHAGSGCVGGPGGLMSTRFADGHMADSDRHFFDSRFVFHSA